MIKRYDIYDIADELADVPGMLAVALDDERIIPEIMGVVRDLERRLWIASTRDGRVGPYPTYKKQPWWRCIFRSNMI